MAKQHSMERLIEMSPKIDFDALDKYCEDELFRNARYVTVGRARDGYPCTCRYCGETYSLQSVYGSGNHNENGICPCCGNVVIFKDEWRPHKTLVDHGYVAIVQKMSNRAVMIRSFYVTRSYWGDWKKLTEFDEHFRIYIHPGGIRTFKNWYWYGWREQKAVGKPIPYNFYQSSIDYSLGIWWQTDLHNTLFKYSCAREFMETVSDKNFAPHLTKYFELYVKNPVLTERLVKEGFAELIEEKLRGIIHGGVCNFRKKTVSEALGLPKRTVAELSGCNSLTILKKKIILENGIKDPDEIAFINELHPYYIRELQRLLKLMTAHKLLKYLSKQIEAERAEDKRYYSINNALSDYSDYLKQCKELNLDLSKSFIMFPQSLSQAHENCTKMLNEIKKAAEEKKRKERDAEFAERYKKLLKKYEYHSGGLFIRPASGETELCMEGTKLNHCVYTNYADKHLSGQCIILFIRKESDPDEPYYTMELSSDGERVIQCRGLRNCGQTPEIERFISEWQNQLKKSKKNAASPAA